MCNKCEEMYDNYKDEWQDLYGYSKWIDHKSSTNNKKPSGMTPFLETLTFETKSTDALRENAYKIVDDAVDILVSKHEDYGPSNIANAPGGPLTGLAVRLHDKVARLANLTSKDKEPKHESLHDTFMDIINYGIIGILVLENNWSKED